MSARTPIEIPEILRIILGELDSLGLVLASFVCRGWREQSGRIRLERKIGKKIYPPADVVIQNTAVLAWLVDNLNGGKLPGWLAARACHAAAELGALGTLQWLRRPGRAAPWDWRTCAQAALNGHLGVLKWARANGCLWNRVVCAKAAEGGHLAVLQWLREAGCPWDETTCTRAAEMGRLEVLQWARANRCPWFASECLHEAKRRGHWAVVKWIRKTF